MHQKANKRIDTLCIACPALESAAPANHLALRSGGSSSLPFPAHPGINFEVERSNLCIQEAGRTRFRILPAVMYLWAVVWRRALPRRCPLRSRGSFRRACMCCACARAWQFVFVLADKHRVMKFRVLAEWRGYTCGRWTGTCQRSRSCPWLF